eukprot:gene9998-2699_t
MAAVRAAVLRAGDAARPLFRQVQLAEIAVAALLEALRVDATDFLDVSISEGEATAE